MYIKCCSFSQCAKRKFCPQVISYFDFINVGKIKVAFAFQIDQLSSLFLLIITGVGFLIHVYSTSYMKEETAPTFCQIFFLPESFCFFNVIAGNGCKLCYHVHRLGRCRIMFLLADRLLV
ncbi:MAG: hypothetical protein WKF59_07025 [Chitinophagaceae bacterium]